MCKAKVPTGFIGNLRKCKRKPTVGKYCYQHQWMATKPEKGTE